MALYVRPHTGLIGRLVVGIFIHVSRLRLNASLNTTLHLVTSRNVRSITQASGKHYMNILGSSTHPQDHDRDLLYTSARSQLNMTHTSTVPSIAMSASQTQASEIVHAHYGDTPQCTSVLPNPVGRLTRKKNLDLIQESTTA